MSHLLPTPRVRAAAGAALVLVASVVLLVVGTGAGPRAATTRSARSSTTPSFVIPGEDVKIAGVKVGKIESLDVTPQKKAAVVLDITQAGLQGLPPGRELHDPPAVADRRGVRRVHADAADRGRRAEAARAQADPRRPAGRRPAPAAAVDQVRRRHLEPGRDRPDRRHPRSMPQRQRLALIIDELGTGLAANGRALHNVVRRADPALAQLDRVLAILASENQTLAALATNSDTVLRPLARDKRQVADFVTKASKVATATAERRVDLERNIAAPAHVPARAAPDDDPARAALGRRDAGLPRPRRQRTADQRPDPPDRALLAGRAAGGPLARQGRGHRQAGGDRVAAAARSSSTRWASSSSPSRSLAAQTLGSFKNSGGVEYFMKYIYYQVAAINGFDALRPLPARRAADHRRGAVLVLRDHAGPELLGQLRQRGLDRVGARVAPPLDGGAARPGQGPHGPGDGQAPQGERGPLPAALRQAGRQAEQGRAARRRGLRRECDDALADRHDADDDRAVDHDPDHRRRPRRSARRPPRATTRRRTSSTTSWGTAHEPPPRRLRRRQPGADRRRDAARRRRGRVPLLQRQQRPAVRADLPAHRAGPERGEPRRRQRGAHRWRPRRRGRPDHAEESTRTAPSPRCCG